MRVFLLSLDANESLVLAPCPRPLGTHPYALFCTSPTLFPALSTAAAGTPLSIWIMKITPLCSLLLSLALPLAQHASILIYLL